MKRILFGSLIILAALIPLLTNSAITTDAITNGASWSNANNWTTQLSINGVDLTIVAVITWWDNSGSISLLGAACNGKVLTFGSHADETSYVYNADTYYLGKPDTGLQNCVVTFSANSYGNVHYISLNGTNSASPKDNSGTGNDSWREK